MTHLLVPGVQHQIRHLVQWTVAPAFELLIQKSCRPAHIGAADVQPAQLPGDLLHPPRRDAVDVHLGDGQRQRPLATQAALEGLRVERLAVVGLAHLRDAEAKLAQTAADRLVLVAVGDFVIQVFDKEGNFLYVVGDERGEIIKFKSPTGIFVDEKMQLYIVEMLADQVRVLSVKNY